MTAKTHHLATVSDILALTAEEFARMLPDLCEMHRVADSLRDIDGIEFGAFDWIDDGEQGVKYVDFIDPDTGEKTRRNLRDES